VVVSTGMKSYNPFSEKLNEKLAVFIIGDAKEVRKAQHAIESGYKLACKL